MSRLMEINPWRIGYLAGHSGRLGPIAERHIEQRGETIEADAASRFPVARSSTRFTVCVREV